MSPDRLRNSGIRPSRVLAHDAGDDPTQPGTVGAPDDYAIILGDDIAIETAPDDTTFRDIVNDQTEMVVRYLPDTTITFANPSFAAFYGYTPAGLVGKKLLDFFTEDRKAGELERLKTFGPDKTVAVQEDPEPRHDGEWRWYQWTDRALLDSDGSVMEFQSVGRDIHVRKMAEQRLQNQSQVLESVARGLPLHEVLTEIALMVEGQVPGSRCAVMFADTAERLVVAAAPSLPADFRRQVPEVPIVDGAGTCGTAAFRRETVVTECIADDPIWNGWAAMMESFGIRSAWSVPLVATDGETVLGTIAVYNGVVGRPDSPLIELVTSMARLAEIAIERTAVEEQLAHEAMHDPLTGLPNRALLIDRLSWALGRARRRPGHLAVLFLDVDGFKVVNDSLGHAVGDALLHRLADRLVATVRPGDTVARFGGDEFVVLCEDLDEDSSRDEAIEIAERLRHALDAPLVVPDAEAYLRASIGIALCDGSVGDADDLLRDADAAMYHAKELGKGRYWVFDDVLRRKALRQHETYNALHRALERDEFRTYFQPIVELTTGRCAGAEALVRWHHPERGLVPPFEFIPLAEQSDLIVQLGERVLEHAAQRAAEWAPAQTGPFSIAVNLAARQLTQPDFAIVVARILAENGAVPEHISFEITESVLMTDADRAIGVIDELEALGVSLSIDDFGTGYSSLAYLKRFSVQHIKIDRSFVSGLGTDPDDAAIVRAIISMADALGLDVVAEGVEDEVQLRELLRMGCRYAQGYYFAKPEDVSGGRPEWSEPSHRWFIPQS